MPDFERAYLRNDCGLWVRIFTSMGANGTKELSGLVRDIEKHYNQECFANIRIPEDRRRYENDAYSYRIFRDGRDVGCLKVIPLGYEQRQVRSQGRRDFPVAAHFNHSEKYLILFLTQTPEFRKRHRDCYARRLKSNGVDFPDEVPKR